MEAMIAAAQSHGVDADGSLRIPEAFSWPREAYTAQVQDFVSAQIGRRIAVLASIDDVVRYGDEYMVVLNWLLSLDARPLLWSFAGPGIVTFCNRDIAERIMSFPAGILQLGRIGFVLEITGVHRAALSVTGYPGSRDESEVHLDLSNKAPLVITAKCVALLEAENRSVDIAP